MRIRKKTLSLFAGLAVAAAVLVAASPASANEKDTLRGDIPDMTGTITYGGTEYINSQGSNEVFIMETNGPQGGTTVLYGENTAGTLVGSVTNPSFNTWYSLHHSGSVVWPNGGFYLAWSVNDACGGSGCTPNYWTGKLQWNLPY